MDKQNLWKRPGLYAILAMLLCGTLFYEYEDRTAIGKEKQLQHELQNIASMPHARIVEQKSLHKGGSAYIETFYSVPSSFQEIADYYSAELKANGWVYKQTRMLPSNIEEVQFCKKSFGFKVTGPLKSTQSPLTFWVDIDWGMNGCSNS